jgi:hypothetical protein
MANGDGRQEPESRIQESEENLRPSAPSADKHLASFVPWRLNARQSNFSCAVFPAAGITL